jgi:hypothetical protein
LNYFGTQQADKTNAITHGIARAIPKRYALVLAAGRCVALKLKVQ